MTNEQLKQSAKDHAAMELYFCDYQQAIEENQLISNIERETFWHLAMEIYAEKVGEAQRTEGIREGFEAAREGAGFWEVDFDYDTADDYLNSKK